MSDAPGAPGTTTPPSNPATASSGGTSRITPSRGNAQIEPQAAEPGVLAQLGPALRYLPHARGRLLLVRLWKPLTVLGLLLGLGIVFAISSGLPASGKAGDSELTREGLRSLAVFAVAVSLWVIEAVPLVVTGLGVFVGLVLAGAGSPAMVASWYGNTVVYFLLGVFLLAGALSAAHVVDHAALRLLNIVGGSPRRLRQGVFWAAFFGSWFMAEHAVAAMLFPVVARIRDGLGLPRGSSRYVRSLFLALAWGCTIGGICTYLGGARIALAMGIAQTKGVENIPGFFKLMAMALPIALPLGLIAAMILELGFRCDVRDVGQARVALAERRRALGRFGPRQWAVSLILAGAVASWIFFGVKMLAPVALATSAILIGSGLVRWKALSAQMPWGLLLMEAGAMALCAALEHTGSAGWAAHIVFGQLSDNPYVVIALVTAAAVVLTELFSNPAVVTLLVPLLIAAAPQLGFANDPLPLVLAVALPCGLSFVLPLGSPPLAIAFSSGEYKVRQVLGKSILLDLLPIPLTVGAYWLFWAKWAAG